MCGSCVRLGILSGAKFQVFIISNYIIQTRFQCVALPPYGHLGPNENWAPRNIPHGIRRGVCYEVNISMTVSEIRPNNLGSEIELLVLAKLSLRSCQVQASPGFEYSSSLNGFTWFRISFSVTCASNNLGYLQKSSHLYSPKEPCQTYDCFT